MRLKIQQAADVVGVSPQTIRKWERHGLIHPPRDSAGDRYFLTPDLVRLKLIKQMLGRGTRLAAAATFLGELDEPPAHRRSELGATLRTLREARGWSRSSAAHRVALTDAHLAALEAGRSNGTLVSLQALATLYGIALIDLVRGRAGADPALVRASDRPVLLTSGSGVVLAGLAQGDVHLRPLLVTADAGAGVDAFHGHPGEEFIWVVSGRLHLAFTDDRAYILDAGDSVAFRSERLHRWHAGDSILQAVWVHRDAALAGPGVEAHSTATPRPPRAGTHRPRRPVPPGRHEKRRGVAPPTPRDAV